MGLSKNIGSFFEERRRLPPTLTLSVVVLLAAWMGNTQGGYFVSGWVPAAFVLVALVLVASAAGGLRVIRGRASLLALGLFSAYAAWTFASLAWSADKGAALLGAGQTLLYLLVFWVASAFMALDASRRWVLGASVLGPATVAAFTLLALEPRLGDLFEHGWLIGTVGYHNGEAAFLLIPFWVAVYLAGSQRVNPLLRGAAFASAALCAQLAVLTESRGAMVALAVSLAVYFLISGARLRGIIALLPVAAALAANFSGLNEVYLAFSKGANPAVPLEAVLSRVWLTSAGAGLYGILWAFADRRWKPPHLLVRVAGAVILACCALGFVVGTAAIVDRYGSPAELAQKKWEAFKTNDTTGQDQSRFLSASGTGRYVLWQVAWRDFTAHPVLGVGTQNYEATYYQLRESTAGSVRQPHSLPLEVLAERGAVGGVLFFGFLAACLGTGLWRRFGNLNAEGKAQAGALAAAVTYWFVHSSAEWFWQLPAVTLPAMVYLALLVSPWQRAEEGAPGAVSGWPLRLVGIGVAALALAILVPLYASDRYLHQSRAAAIPQKALVLAERAGKLNPLDPQVPDREAGLAIEMGRWGLVEKAYRQEIRLNPDHYAPYMYLGDYYARRGEDRAALTYYRRASLRNPLDAELKQKMASLR